MSNYYIKLYHEILDDPKMGRLPDHLYRRVIELFLLAGVQDQEGLLPPVEIMAWKLHINQDNMIGFYADLQAISDIGIIYTNEDGGIIVTNFAKRQERVTDVERKRYQRQRDRINNPIVTKRDNIVTENVTNVVRELKLDKELKIELDKKTQASAEEDKSVLLTTFDECSAYFERVTGYPITPNKENIDAINEWVEIGTTKSDIDGAIVYFSKNGYVARNPIKLSASVAVERGKRVQAEVKISTPAIDPRSLASEVYE